jgi:hypothetical protein
MFYSTGPCPYSQISSSEKLVRQTLQHIWPPNQWQRKTITFAGNTYGGRITVLLTSCFTALDWSVLQIKTKIVSCHTADNKRVKQEVNSTVILPPLVFSDICNKLLRLRSLFAPLSYAQISDTALSCCPQQTLQLILRRQCFNNIGSWSGRSCCC